MNTGECGSGATTPYANDVAAARILYPQPQFSVQICGPVFTNNSSCYTWSAAASNGNAPCTHSWRYSCDNGVTHFYPSGNNSASVTNQMLYAQSLYLRVTARDRDERLRNSFFMTDQGLLK